MATPWGPGLCIIHLYHFLSLQMNEILQFISLQMNEILKMEPTVHLNAHSMFPLLSKSRSPSHNFFVLKHVTFQILDFISVS